MKRKTVMSRPRFITRTIFAVLLCLVVLAAIAFLVVVDLADGVSRNEDSWAKVKEPVLQDLPSVKLSDGD